METAKGRLAYRWIGCDNKKAPAKNRCVTFKPGFEPGTNRLVGDRSIQLSYLAILFGQKYITTILKKCQYTERSRTSGRGNDISGS